MEQTQILLLDAISPVKKEVICLLEGEKNQDRIEAMFDQIKNSQYSRPVFILETKKLLVFDKHLNRIFCCNAARCKKWQKNGKLLFLNNKVNMCFYINGSIRTLRT